MSTEEFHRVFDSVFLGSAPVTVNATATNGGEVHINVYVMSGNLPPPDSLRATARWVDRQRAAGAHPVPGQKLGFA